MTATTTGQVKRGPDRDFNYIKPSGRRLSEYEAVNLYVQIEDGLMNSEGWFVKGHDHRDPWRSESTRLQHPHWFDFRDPAKKWQRTHTRGQADLERSIERLTEESIRSGLLADIDEQWLNEIVRKHYRAWSYAEAGTFRPFASQQREALSDTIAAAMVFEGLDRLRHAQDVVIWLMELEENLPGFKDGEAKGLWTDDPVYQPSRRVIEKLMFGQWDWAELAVATSLVVDPILTEVALFQLVLRNGAVHGDVVSAFIASTAKSDRVWSRAWTEALVRMVTADDVPAAAANRAVIEEWVAEWSLLAVEAAEALGPIYEQVPRSVVKHADALATALANQRTILEGLGLHVGVTA